MLNDVVLDYVLGDVDVLSNGWDDWMVSAVCQGSRASFFSVGMSFHRPCEKESDWLSMSSVICQFFKTSCVAVKLTK